MKMQLEESYLDLLKTEFLSRKRKNKMYSMRAFATHLGLSVSYVSLLMRSKRQLSVSKANLIAEKLKWPQVKQKYFLKLVQFQKAHSESDQEVALEELQKLKNPKTKFSPLDLDSFATIAFWHYGAILSLLTLPGLHVTTQVICQRLSLRSADVELALKRLQRLKLIRFEKQFWVATNDFFRVKSAPSVAVRNYHKQLLSKAAEAIEQQRLHERDFSNITLTVDAAHMDLAKKKIVEFQTDMAQLLETQNATDVYQLSVQLFRLTKTQEDLNAI